MKSTEYVVVLVTAPANNDTADSIAETVVEAGLAACVNVVPAIKSIYRWNGKIEKEVESLMIIKTESRFFDKLKEKILTIHPYDIPEIIMLPITDGNSSYLRWISESMM